MDIEKKIRDLLEQKRISVRELCKQIGMSDVNLYRRFKANSIETRHLEKIAGVCGVEIAYFFTGTQKGEGSPAEMKEYILESRQKAYNHNALRETQAMTDFLLGIDFDDPADQKRLIDKVQLLAFHYGLILDNIVEFEDLEEKIKKFNPDFYRMMFFDANNMYLRTPNQSSK